MRTIEELFEEDIQRFLDERIGFVAEKRKVIRAEEQNVFSLQKDYVKEVEKALEKNNVDKAKKLFEELKSHYVKLKYSDIDKAKIFRTLDAVHLKIKNYLISKQKEKDIFQEIKDFEVQEASLQKKGDKLNELLLLFTELDALVKGNEMEKAKEKAKKVIAIYNSLEPANRKAELYNKIKEVIIKIK